MCPECDGRHHSLSGTRHFLVTGDECECHALVMPPGAPDPLEGTGTFLTGLDNDDNDTQKDRMDGTATSSTTGLGSTLPYIHKLSSSGRTKEKASSPYNVPNKHMRVYFPK